MKECNLSVIIPVYNGERFLRDTLDSVLGQTYNSFELIVVDDGSTDSTAQICDEYAKKDRRIRVLHQKNGGMSNARDNGYKIAAENTWIAFLDADDIFAPNMFKDMMKYKSADIVCVCFKSVNNNKILKYNFDTAETFVEFMSGRKMLDVYFDPSQLKGSIGNLWGMLINREFYRKIEPIIRTAQNKLPQNYLNDAYCVPRFLMKASNTVLLNNIYVLHRVSKYSDSMQLKPNALSYELALVNKMNREYYKSCNCDFAYEKHLISFYLVILKLWYQIVTRGGDDRWKERVSSYYNEYYDELKFFKCKSINDKLKKYSIMLWGVNKSLWRFTVGMLRYEIIYKLQYII